MSLDYIASAEACAAAEAQLRDTALQKRVDQYLGGYWPFGFEETTVPIAVFAPYLMRGSELELEFVDLAETSGFKPAIATYMKTEFVTANPALVDCFRPPLKLPKGQQSRDWIVKEADRKGRLGSTPTKYDSTIDGFPAMCVAEYWSNVASSVQEEHGVSDLILTDFGDWYAYQAKRFGWQGERSKSPFYYKALMGLYASGRAVLFDTPPTSFADNVMAPAVRQAKEELGAEPLITCELAPGKRDWVDVSFLGECACDYLQAKGRVK